MEGREERKEVRNQRWPMAVVDQRSAPWELSREDVRSRRALFVLLTGDITVISRPRAAIPKKEGSLRSKVLMKVRGGGQSPHTGAGFSTKVGVLLHFNRRKGRLCGGRYWWFG